MCSRLFYYSDAWAADRLAIPGPELRPPTQWWDEEGVEWNDSLASEVEIDPIRGRTPREHLDGLVETFAIGWPRAKLIRKQGFGSDPPFRRMWSPRSVVVEMRTIETRTFGFFSRAGVFVAMRVDLTDRTHANDNRLYGFYGDYVLQRLRHIDPADVDATSDVETLIGS
jgi:hypothetical protein